MKTRNTIFLLGALVLTIASRASAQEWRKIVPLKSTRADVERLLGPAEQPYGVDYELNDGVLSIEYSTGPCRKDRRGGWNVPEGVVISFSFSAKHKRRVTDLKLSRKKFRKVIDTHTAGITYYINDEDGITYEVQQGRVEGVEYYPPRKYDHLYCGDGADEKIGVVQEPPHYIYVFTMENEGPKLIWSFETGDRADGGLRQIYAEHGNLVMELFGKDRVVGGELYKGEEGSAARVHSLVHVTDGRETGLRWVFAISSIIRRLELLHGSSGFECSYEHAPVITRLHLGQREGWLDGLRGPESPFATHHGDSLLR